jgi:DNA-binding response OmpR family regulator
VLVVEDDPNVRGLLQILLTTEGYEVVTASDGIAGLLNATAHRPALVVLDVMMPDLGGPRVMEELQATEGLRDVPVLVVTGHIESVPQLRSELGDDRVFVKPFAVTELLERVEALTGGARRSGS